MSLFAVWRFVRIYCPMSCSITLSDFLSEFFLPLLVCFFVLFFVRIREMPYSISLSDFLFDFFARYFVPRLVRFCLRLFCPNLYVRFLAGFPSDFLSQFIVRCLLVRSLCVIFCPTISFDFLSDFCVRFVLSDFFFLFFARYLVRFVFPMSQPLICPWFFILMQVKLIFTRKVEHLTSFWKWWFLELGSGLLAKTL